MHPSLPLIRRLLALSQRATAHRHLGWAANLYAAAVVERNRALHEMHMAARTKKGNFW